MAQHDYNIEDQNGFDFLVDLNNALSAIATNNAGPSEPNPTFANMLWFDTNNDLMKMRNEANSEWVIVAKKDASGWTPYRQGTALGTASVQPDTRYAHRSNNLSDLGSAATARANLGVDATGTAPLFACRAWVKFNGTGTVIIRASGNVSSITDNGTGDYTVNFATAMQDKNYATTANWTNGSLTRKFQDGPVIPVGDNVDFVRILLTDGAADARDGSAVSVAIFR
jgi:hypothetical protein